MIVLSWYRLLLHFQLLRVELSSPFYFNVVIFARFRAKVPIANTVAAGLVRPVDPLHGLPFSFHLQARLAGPPLARRRDSLRLGRLRHYFLARVREHAGYLGYVARFRRHRQRHPLTRDPPHNVAENSSLRGQKLKTSDSSQGKLKMSFWIVVDGWITPIAPLL